jgi:hypothetical protein
MTAMSRTAMIAGRIATVIERDIQSRRGIGDEWEAVDYIVRQEIHATWVKLIMAEMEE